MFYGSNNKFRAKKTIYNGTVYDSKGEARLAAEIDLLIRAKEYKGVERQVKFNLYGKNNTKICTHIVDFVLSNKDGSLEVWAFKGVETKDFRIKHKLFLDNYPDIKYIIVK